MPKPAFVAIATAHLENAVGGLAWEGHPESNNVIITPNPDPLTTPGAFTRWDRAWDDLLIEYPDLEHPPAWTRAELNNLDRAELAYRESNERWLADFNLDAFGPGGWGPFRPEGPPVNDWILDVNDARAAVPPPVDGAILDANDARAASPPPVDGTILDANDARAAAPAAVSEPTDIPDASWGDFSGGSDGLHWL